MTRDHTRKVNFHMNRITVKGCSFIHFLSALEFDKKQKVSTEKFIASPGTSPSKSILRGSPIDNNKSGKAKKKIRI
jgi:hypothetical protein